MSELKCGAENCVYNIECLCSKGEICVGGKHADTSDQTCCESFAPHREGMDVFTNSISHPSKNISIDCEAVKCMYNENYRCKADRVDIRGLGARGSAQTCCKTFREA